MQSLSAAQGAQQLPLVSLTVASLVFTTHTWLPSTASAPAPSPTRNTVECPPASDACTTADFPP